MRYYDRGYMADWLLNTANGLRVNKVTLDILKSTIDPKEMEVFPLIFHLKDLKNILLNELTKNGFDQHFLIDAKIIVEIPDRNIYSKTLYCYPELTDIMGRKYKTGRLIETAYEEKFDSLAQHTVLDSFLLRAKRFFKIP